MSSGHGEDLERLAEELKKSFECKAHVLGPEEEDMKEIKVLNRILTCVIVKGKEVVI